MRCARRIGDPHVTVWGSGRPRREFLHVDDLADLVYSVVGYQGDIVYDATKPDGTPRKVLDVSRITELGWKARTGLGRPVWTLAGRFHHSSGLGGP